MRVACVALALLASACAHVVNTDRCDGERSRRSGVTALRHRNSASAAIVFLQGMPARDSLPPLFFWPERLTGDSLFDPYDVYVLALARADRWSCDPSDRTKDAIATVLRDRGGDYDRLIVVAHDVTDVLALQEAASRLPADLRGRVRRVFLFHTPEADRRLLERRDRCRAVSGTAAGSEPVPTVVCSTFDEKRLADAPLAGAACRTILFARMSDSMKRAPLCGDALYEIFRGGLAGTIDDAGISVLGALVPDARTFARELPRPSVPNIDRP